VEKRGFTSIGQLSNKEYSKYERETKEKQTKQNETQ
jgi:hypothetical protein